MLKKQNIRETMNDSLLDEILIFIFVKYSLNNEIEFGCIIL